jgi:hypothetical protein
MREAAQAYAAEVRERTFPSEAQSAKMDAAVIAVLREERAPSTAPDAASPATGQGGSPAEGQADGYAPPKKRSKD